MKHLSTSLALTRRGPVSTSATTREGKPAVNLDADHEGSTGMVRPLHKGLRKGRECSIISTPGSGVSPQVL